MHHIRNAVTEITQRAKGPLKSDKNLCQAPSFRYPAINPFRISRLDAKFNHPKAPIDSTRFAKLKTYKKEAPNPSVRGFPSYNQTFAQITR